MFDRLVEGLPQRILFLGSGVCGEKVFDDLLNLQANLKFARFELALLGLEGLAFGLHRVLLQVLLIGEDLGELLDQIRGPRLLGGENLLGLPEGHERLLLISHCVTSFGLGDLIAGPSHVGDRFALKEGEFGPAEAAERFFINRFLARLHEGLEELAIAIDDRLLGASQTSLVDLGVDFLLKNFDSPLLRLSLHELLGFDDLADLLHEEIVHQHGVGTGDDLAEFLHDLFDRFARLLEVRVGLLGLWCGIELLACGRQLVAGAHYFARAQLPQIVAGLGKGDRAAFFSETIGLQVVQKEAHAPHDGRYSSAHAILPVDLAAKSLLGADDAIGVLVFLSVAGKGQQGGRTERQGDDQATCFHRSHPCLLRSLFRCPLRSSIAGPPFRRRAPDCGSVSALRSGRCILCGTSLNTFRW